MFNKCFLSVIREMQIKIALRFHLTPGRMLVIEKTNDHEGWQGCKGRETLLHC